MSATAHPGAPSKPDEAEWQLRVDLAAAFRLAAELGQLCRA